LIGTIELLAGVAVALTAGVGLLHHRQIARMRTYVGRLVAQALGAEDRARRKLAIELHDDAIQTLLAARVALGRARRGESDGFEHADRALIQTVARLRRAVFDLYPPTLEHSGLARTIEELAANRAQLSGIDVRCALDEIESSHDQLVFSVARELISNAVQHSGGQRVDVRLDRTNEALVLQVEDDGVGLNAEARAAAVKKGHIGLVSSAERVEALGGRFDVEAEPGRGTRVTISLPERRRRDRAPEIPPEAPGEADRRSTVVS
jgi:two-component system, NarL family, sensor kinase